MRKKNKRQTYHPAMVTAAKPTEFNPDYSTTRQDLRRIAILAGSFLAFLIVLAIFQNQLLALIIK
jgi:hypothetical protein